MTKQNEWPYVLVENTCNVVFNCLILSVYGNSSLSRSSTKLITYFYLHANVIDYVGTTTITINIKGTLLKTHFELIKKGNFLRLQIFFVKNKFDYDKGDSNWTIELSIAIKGTIVLPFDLPIKLLIDPKDIINNFGWLHVITFCNNITFVISGVLGEINGKFELLVVNGTSTKDIQIVNIYTTLSSIITLYYYVFNK